MVIPNWLPMQPGGSRSITNRADRISFPKLGRMDVLVAYQKGLNNILSCLVLVLVDARRRVRFSFIGKGSERARLTGIARRLAPAEIEFVESLPNQQISQRLDDADCVVLASRYEVMSIFALEAATPYSCRMQSVAPSALATTSPECWVRSRSKWRHDSSLPIRCVG